MLIRDKSKNYYSCCQKPEKDIWLYKDMDYLLDFALTGYPRKENKELGNILIARVYPKLYRSELAKSVQFKENIRMSEDDLYSSDILSKSRCVGVTDECWYTYYQNEYSLYYNVQGIDKKFQYMLQNSEYLYCYFILRCIRRKLGQVKRKLKSFS